MRELISLPLTGAVLTEYPGGPAEAANLLLEGLDPKLLFLVENQWWPGFTFTDPAQTRRLLDAHGALCRHIRGVHLQQS